MTVVNIRTLAQQLHLSAGTVSKALKDSHEISESTKKKVLQLARQLHYVPNPYASSLRKKRSQTIAVVLPEVADSFFSLAINGIESVAQKKGYHVLIYLTHENFMNEKMILRDIKSGRVDGVLISVTRETKNSKHIDELKESGIPVVLFDRVIKEPGTAKVFTNDFESGFAATRHLIERGCSNIAYLSISKNLSIFNDRMSGYQRALKEYHLPFNKYLLVECGNYDQSNFNRIKKLMLHKHRPDGLIASVEKLLITAYEVCHQLGLRIPEEVKLIGFSLSPFSTILAPSVTTITQPAFEMGEAAASLLFKSLEKTNFRLENQQLMLPSLLSKRDST